MTKTKAAKGFIVKTAATYVGFAADANAVAAIAKEAGFSISADDLKNAQSEISDEELEGVAGGGQDPQEFKLPGWAQDAVTR